MRILNAPTRSTRARSFRRAINRISVCLAVLMVRQGYGQASADSTDNPRRPNLIFLMADDQNTYSLGCYDAPEAKTPRLDQLAADGIVFDRHYDTTAICMASRASVFTGMFEYKTGCNFDHGPLLETHWQRSYPILLRKAGYTTAFAGKFGIEIASTPGKKGRLGEQDFNRWGGGPGQTSYQTRQNKSMVNYAEKYPHSTLAYGAFGADFVKEAAQGTSPFCLSISFKAPHHPVTPDPQFDEIYAGYSFTKPANFGREHGLHFSKQSQQGRQYERFHSWHYSDQYDAVMAKYYQQIYAIDVAVGMIRDAVQAAGVRENTVIIYTSDNGFMCGAHGYGSKVLPYEEASRVPLIMFDPRHQNSGQHLRCGALTGNVDFMPTLLELAGVPVPANVDGKSLCALYDDPQAETHQTLPLINVWGPKPVHSLAVVTKDWKYIYWPYADGDFEPTEELYHIAQDPLELTNLIEDAKTEGERQRLRTLYDQRVGHWSQTTVSYHNYQPFATFFRRRSSKD